jgi:uroporphyrinogen-III synthase
VAGNLRGRRVVITRTAEQNAALRALLEERGAIVLEVPLIEVLEPEDEGR